MSKIIVRTAPPGIKDTQLFKDLVWKKIRIRKSLDEICHYVEVELPIEERKKIQLHSRLEVRYSSESIYDYDYKAVNRKSLITDYTRRVTTIIVDEISETVDSSSHYLTVIGRSPARDIIDSTWKEGFTNKTLLQLSSKISERFNVTSFPIPRWLETDPVEPFSWDCESPWTKLLNEAENQGLFITSNESGDLYVLKLGQNLEPIGFNILEGINLKKVKIIERGAEQFYKYIINGTYQATDSEFPEKYRCRIKSFKITDPKMSKTKLEARVKNEVIRRREKKIHATVTGWGLTDEQILNIRNSHKLEGINTTREKEIFWNPGYTVGVNIPSCDLKNTSFLITQVEYTADTSNFICDITMTKPEVYK